MVSVLQTATDFLEWSPHVHALVSRGAWDRSGRWRPVPYVDTKAAELLYRDKVLALLDQEDLISEERKELLMSWKNTGFSVHNSVTVDPQDPKGAERLARYLMRPPLSLERMSFDEQGCVLYQPKPSRRFAPTRTFDPQDFLARLLIGLIPKSLSLATLRSQFLTQSTAAPRRGAAVSRSHGKGY